MAYATLGLLSSMRGDREQAARRYRRGLNAASAAGGVVHEKACDALRRLPTNLRVLEATDPVEKALLNLQLGPQTETGFSGAGSSAGTSAGSSALPPPPRWVPCPAGPPVARPLCDGCGAALLAVKRCTGSCAGAGVFCGQECLVKHWKEHKRLTGCRKLPAADPPAAAAPARARAAPARPASARAAAPPALAAVQYEAHVDDGKSRRHLSCSVPVDADLLLLARAAGRGGGEAAAMAAKMLMQLVSLQTHERIMALAPWTCVGCGAGAAPARGVALRLCTQRCFSPAFAHRPAQRCWTGWRLTASPAAAAKRRRAGAAQRCMPSCMQGSPARQSTRSQGAGQPHDGRGLHPAEAGALRHLGARFIYAWWSVSVRKVATGR